MTLLSTPILIASIYAMTEYLSRVLPDSVPRVVLTVVAPVLGVLLAVAADLALSEGLSLEAAARGVVMGLATVWLHNVRKAVEVAP